MLKTDIKSELSIIRYMFSNFFLYRVYMEAALSKFLVYYLEYICLEPAQGPFTDQDYNIQTDEWVKKIESQ